MSNPSVVSVSVDDAHRFSKVPGREHHPVAGIGVQCDAHAGVTVQHRSRVAADPSQPDLRQVHLLADELLDESWQDGFDVRPGQLGEHHHSRSSASRPASRGHCCGSVTTRSCASPACETPAGRSTISLRTCVAAGSGTGQCAGSRLRASIDPRHISGNGTPGKNGRLHHAVIVEFQNISPRSCVLYSCPGAAIIDRSGKQHPQATGTLRGEPTGPPVGETAPALVTLAPRAFAAASLEGTDLKNPGSAQAGCEPSGYPKILVTPPNTRITVPFTVGWPMCYSFQVHPVQPLPDAP